MSKKTEAKPTHSRIGASSAKRWLRCPGSIPLNAEYPQAESVYAAEGTAAHELAEKCLRTGFDAIKYQGEKFNNKRFTATEEMCDAVQVYLDEVRRIKTLCDPDIMAIEVKTNLAWIHPDLYGTADAVLGVTGEKLWVFDYKHGVGVAVEVEENEQLLYYMLGVAKQYNFQFESYEVVVVQPRCGHRDGPIRRWPTTRERLEEFEKTVRAGMAKVEEAEAAHADILSDLTPYLCAGDWCRSTFCGATVNCPKLQEQMRQTLLDDFDALDGDLISVTPMPPNDLSPESMSRALDFADVMEHWIKELRSKAHRMAENGLPPPEYELVEKRGHRKFVEAEKVVDTLTMLGVPENEMYAPPELKSPAQMEKTLKRYKVDKSFVDGFAAAPKIGTTLVRKKADNRAVDPLELFDASVS